MNFHKLSTGHNKNGKSDAVGEMSERIKTLTQIHNLHIMMTVELRKANNSTDRPSLADLKDSVQLEYDADLIYLIHNDYQVDQNSPRVYRKKDTDTGEELIMPYVEVMLAKNKVTGRIMKHIYKLNTICLKMDEESLEKFAMVDKKNAVLKCE